MMLSYVLVCLVFAATLVSEVTPLPTGAIGCPQGIAAVAGPHVASNPLPGNGALSAGGFNVTIDGTPLDPEVAFPISVGTEYVVKVTGPSMKGFLIRAGGGSAGVNTVNALGFDEIMKEEIQVADACLAESVGGLTHTNNGSKTGVAGMLLFDETSEGYEDIILDVTVVDQLVSANSVYYHSSYKLNVM